MPRNSRQEVYPGSPHPFSLTYIKHVDVTKDASHQQYFRLVIESSWRIILMDDINEDTVTSNGSF